MRATLVNNSHFFARLELRSGKVWLVWGNPNQENTNETLIKDSTIRSVRDWLCIITERGRHIE